MVTPSSDDNADAASDAKDHLAAIVGSSFDAIISKDLNSVILTWNGAAERLFGWSAEEAIGKSILMLIPDNRQGEEADIIARVKRGEQLASYETIRQRKDGKLIAVSLTVSPIRNRRGEIVGASKIARDISAARENERRIRLLMREVNHRVKNQFAVILSMVRETGQRSGTTAEFESALRERIMALSRSHDLLVNSDWSGASLSELLDEHLKPFGREKQITHAGTELTLTPNAVQNLGMAFHELGTNSAKYGALSDPSGRLDVKWEVLKGDDGVPEFCLSWTETSRPRPAGKETGRKGFGTVVLQRVAPQSLGGHATLEREPGRLQWVLRAPLEDVVDLPDA